VIPLCACFIGYPKIFSKLLQVDNQVFVATKILDDTYRIEPFNGFNF